MSGTTSPPPPTEHVVCQTSARHLKNYELIYNNGLWVQPNNMASWFVLMRHRVWEPKWEKVALGTMLSTIFSNEIDKERYRISLFPILHTLKCPCLMKEVKLSVNISFQLCIPVGDNKNTDKALMLLQKHGASKLPSVLVRFSDPNTRYFEPLQNPPLRVPGVRYIVRYQTC